jgi:hypothetical protein
MRKRFLTVLLMLAFTILINFGLWSGEKARALSMNIHIKDLPESGISIIGPSDPAFDQKISALKIKPAQKELIKPFSVLINNTGEKAIVAFKLRWECKKADGSVVYKDVVKSSSWVFTDSEADQPISADPTIIKPHSIWFHSLVSQSQPSEGGTGGGWVVVGDPNSTETQDLLKSPNGTQALKALNAELARYVSITISFDGAFFDDGTFVGPDATGFFELIKAQVDAKHDPLQAMKVDSERGKSADQILQSIEGIANDESVDFGAAETASDYYKYYKKIYAKEIVADRSNSDSSKAFEKVIRRLNKPRVKLRKK